MEEEDEKYLNFLPWMWAWVSEAKEIPLCVRIDKFMNGRNARLFTKKKTRKTSVSIFTEEDNEWKKILPIYFSSFFLCERADIIHHNNGSEKLYGYWVRSEILRCCFEKFPLEERFFNRVRFFEALSITKITNATYTQSHTQIQWLNEFQVPLFHLLYCACRFV